MHQKYVIYYQGLLHHLSTYYLDEWDSDGIKMTFLSSFTHQWTSTEGK